MAAILVNAKAKVRAKAVAMALATSTEALVIQAKAAMGVVMSHVRVVDLVVGAGVDAVIKEA